MTHDEIQASLKDYRARARELITNKVAPLTNITVPNEAHVAPTEDGAFVECVMWVPKKKEKDA